MRLGYECDSETRGEDIPVDDSRLNARMKFDTEFNTNGFATVLFNFVKQKVSKRTLKLSCLVIPVSGNSVSYTHLTLPTNREV